MTRKTITDAVKELGSRLPPGDGDYLYYHRNRRGDGHYLRAENNVCDNCQYVGMVNEFLNAVALEQAQKDAPGQPPWHEAPSDATYAGWCSDSNCWRWYKWEGDRYFFQDYGVDRFWRMGRLSGPANKPLHQRPQEHPTPPTSEWPPVGTHCRVTWGRKEVTHECVVLPDKQLVTKNDQDNWNLLYIKKTRKGDMTFLPLEEPERERWVRKAKPYVRNSRGYRMTSGIEEETATRFYDALLNGELPVPGGDDQ